MPGAEWYLTDRLRVFLPAEKAERLLSRAAGAGIRLHGVRRTSEGCLADISGRDFPRLRQIAAQMGQRVEISRRLGPGRLLQWIWRRPGLWLGGIACLILLRFLPGFVWNIDFGTLDPSRQTAVREILASAGIQEGSWIRDDMLQAARQQLASQPELFGWIALNFAGGSLYVESTPLKQQAIRQTTPETALYAAADAEILAVQVESGFAQVKPGQIVAEGQLLANGQRADREGNPVTQAASGAVIGQMVQACTAEIPLEQQRLIPTGRSATRRTLFLLGQKWELDGDGPPFADAAVQISWQPLTLGQLALPGCLYVEQSWELTEQTIAYSRQAAAALARRSCVRQLLDAWPDAEIRQQQFDLTQTETGVSCRANFTFCADIAVPGPVQPLPEPQES